MDYRLKQALACSELNDCSTCPFAQACRDGDDFWVDLQDRSWNGTRFGIKGRGLTVPLGQPPKVS